MTGLTTPTALQQRVCRDCEQMLRQQTPESTTATKSRTLPVHARRSERRFILDLPFVD